MQAFVQAIRFVVIDVIIMAAYFPLWWYGQGVVKLLRMIEAQMLDIARSLNLKILARYLFTPMYGLTDIVSRLISFPVRVAHFLVLTTMALVYSALLLFVLAVWLAAPIIITYNVLYQLEFVHVNMYDLL